MSSSNQILRVWAPRASAVEAKVNDQVEPLQRDKSRPGWWLGKKTWPAGTRYGFLLDGNGPFPDPRSPSQPDGVHGLSCLVDHSTYTWQDQNWQPPVWEKAAIYELHIGTFSEEGTFEGAIQYLDSLVRLGITHVEIMPVAEFPGTRGWGYDGVSLYAPHHAYGGVDGLKKLVDACHARGLAAVMDVVYNHLGPDGNYLPLYGPYFTDRHITPWGEATNMDDEGSSESRRFFIDNALMWLRDYHCDGLRLDAIDKILDDSPKHFLVDLREVVDKLEEETGIPRVLIAETASNDPVYVQPVAEGGRGMHAQWNDDLHHAMRTVFTGENESYYMDFGTPEQLTKALRQGFVYDGCHSPFRNKPHGKSPTGLLGSTFLAYLQTHDQVGNRPAGDRFHHHPQAGIIQQKVAASFVLLSPFIPMIFMGEEWAASTPFLYFTHHQDPMLGKAVSEGRKREFGGSGWEGEVPDPQEEETFRRSKLIWAERHAPEHCGMLGWYSELLRLRREIPEFHNHEMSGLQVEADPAGRWLWMKRGPYHVVAALREGFVETPLPAPANASVLLQAGGPRVGASGSLSFDGTGVLIFKEP